MKTIEIKCQGADTLLINDMSILQGDLKDISDHDMGLLIASIVDEGFSFPIFIWKQGAKNWILDGTHRFKALVKMQEGYNGQEWTIPPIPVAWIEADTLEHAKKKLLKATSSFANITFEGLKQFSIGLADMSTIIDSIKLPDFNAEKYKLKVLGESDANTALTPEADNMPDNVPPMTSLGDIYQLGDHLLHCGDSTTDYPEQFKTSDMVLTDPPYNVAYAGGSKAREAIANDDIAAFPAFLEAFYSKAYNCLVPGGAIYVCHSDLERHTFTEKFLLGGFKLSSVIVWVKNNSTFASKDYFWKHEPILYGWHSGASHKWYGPDNEDSVWCIDRPSRSDEHPTMKPVELCARAIKNSSKTGDIVLDPFGGSGSTLIACEELNRKCQMIELDPKNCDIIIKRWEDLSGKKAVKL